MSEKLVQRLDEAWALLASAADDQWLGELFPPLVAAASDRPELRGLFPFTSLRRLCFSRCSDYPFTDDCPCIGVAHNGYVVQETSVVSDEPPVLLSGATLDLERVLQTVVDHLPSDRTAWLGTRADR